MTNVTIKAESIIRKVEQKNILDVRTFQPHQVKESEEWNWHKLKNEKWFVYLDCDTKKFKRWKLKTE